MVFLRYLYFTPRSQTCEIFNATAVSAHQNAPHMFDAVHFLFFQWELFTSSVIYKIKIFFEWNHSGNKKMTV